MARIAGVDIPRDKQMWVALQRIYGVGPTLSLKILSQAGVDAAVSVLVKVAVPSVCGDSAV